MFAYQKHGDQSYNSAFLGIIGCKPADVPILRFMMKGIDAQTRRIILEMKPAVSKSIQ